MPEQTFSESIKRVRNTEYAISTNGTEVKRKINPDGTRTEWEPISLPPPESKDSSLLLMLVLQRQAPGEPKHWQLFVAKEGEPGSVYQVTGDATFMHYDHKQNEPVLSSPDYNTSYVLAQLGKDGEATVKRFVDGELSPRAENRAAVRENCQGWTVRVIERLVEEGIVDGKWAFVAKGLQEPV